MFGVLLVFLREACVARNPADAWFFRFACAPTWSEENWCISIPCLADLLTLNRFLVSATYIESCQARVQFKVEEFIRHRLHRAGVISVLSQAHTVNRRASDSGPYHAHVQSFACFLGGLHANQVVASNFRSGFRLCEESWRQNGRNKRISAHSGSEVPQRGIVGFN